MVTRNGAPFNLNSSKSRTPTIIPKPTVQSVSKAVVELEQKYTNILSKCDEVLSLRKRLDDIEEENQKLCARMTEIERENSQLKEQLSALKPVVTDEVATKPTENSSSSSATCDIDGNVITFNNKKRRDRKKNTNRFNTNENRFVHSNHSTKHQPPRRVPVVPKRSSRSNGSQNHHSSVPNSPPKWKWFHVSSVVRLTSDTVRNYLVNKLNISEVRCFSLTPTNSKTYKVGVPVECARKLFDMSFWPVGTYVRDFDVRKNFQLHPFITVDR